MENENNIWSDIVSIFMEAIILIIGLIFILIIAWFFNLVFRFTLYPLIGWFIENGLSGVWEGIGNFFRLIWCGKGGCN